VDSDEEDLAESIGSFTLRDTVRDCLEKDPADRTDEDIEVSKSFLGNPLFFLRMGQRTVLTTLKIWSVIFREANLIYIFRTGPMPY
jgi:Rap guanine nucleotide exchange factor 2